MACGIYRIYHKATGKSYVGQSIDITGRLWNHFHMLNNGSHHCTYLQHAFSLYGAEAFERQILETCEQSELTEREQFWMDTARYMYGVYNLAPAAGSSAGVKRTKETRHRMSEARKGCQTKPATEEHRRKLSNALTGRTLSEETRRKISEARKGRKCSDEHRQRISESLKGNTLSEEHKQNVSEGVARNWAKRKSSEGVSL